jgi:hypothetical protein
MGKKLGSTIVAVLLALGAFAYGVFSLTRTDVSCGGDPMTVEDICVETKNGSTTEFTYDQIKSEQSRTGYIALGVGVVLLGVAGWQFVSGRKTASVEPPAAPPAVPSA